MTTRHRPGSDIDLCLQAPTMTLGQLLVLDHIDRVGITLWRRPISTPS